LQNLRVKDDLEEVDLDRITILKRIFQKGIVKLWTELKYFKWDLLVEFCEHDIERLCSVKAEYFFTS
jgi:hypothetical protein